MTAYAWSLAQVPTILAHLRDSMVPLQSTQYDRTRITGTKDNPLPLRLEAMTDADMLWAALVDYGRLIAAHITPSPHALTLGSRIRASEHWQDVGEAAHTITAWLRYHEDRIGELDPNVAGTDETLFHEIRRLLGKYRITPSHLRTTAIRCHLCGEVAVRAEWAMNRAGEIAETAQCTTCLRRYDPGEVRRAVDVQGSGEAGAPLSPHDQAVA